MPPKSALSRDRGPPYLTTALVQPIRESGLGRCCFQPMNVKILDVLSSEPSRICQFAQRDRETGENNYVVEMRFENVIAPCSTKCEERKEMFLLHFASSYIQYIHSSKHSFAQSFLEKKINPFTCSNDDENSAMMIVIIVIGG